MSAEAADVRRHILFKRDGERKLAPALADHMLAALDAGAAPDYQALLRAASWPTPPRVMFHTAPVTARDTITTEGLRPTQPGADGTDAWSDTFGVYASQPVGVYVAEQPDRAGRWSRWTRWDIWQVDIEGLAWVPDEMNPRCYVITQGIEPDRLTFVETR